LNYRTVLLALSMFWLLTSTASDVSLAQPGSEAAPVKQIAIIIDDFGNGMAGTEQMMELPIPFAAAVMPFLSTTKRDAEWAHGIGKEVLVHLPMEPRAGKREWLGPGAITTRLSDDEIRKRVNAAVEDVPHAVGINNHMGSKATADERVMRIVLSVCKERNLFFLDSRTTHKSVIGRLANEMGVRTAKNHIFMDDVYTRSHIMKQAIKVQKHVKKYDSTIVIGHVGSPGKYTAEVLKKSIPSYKELGGHFVSVSHMVK
jgi:polysaccharide deacetylase 2 family uncharacterized protein YibQ